LPARAMSPVSPNQVGNKNQENKKAIRLYDFLISREAAYDLLIYRII